MTTIGEHCHPEVLAHFSRAEAEFLAVLESPSSLKIVGMLTEAATTRRYVEELGRAAQGVLDLS